MKFKFRKLTVLMLIVALAMFSPPVVSAEEPGNGNESADTGEKAPEENMPGIGEETLGEENGSDIGAEALEESENVDAGQKKIGEGSENGVGEVEGSVETDIYQVVLPTVSNSAFDFIIDPQGLINKTNGAAYDGKTFEENSTLFFKRTDGKVIEDYSSTSDEIKITNMGSNDIKVSLHIGISPESLDGIQLTGDREFRDDTSASIYLALIDGKNVVPIGSEGIDMDVTVSAAPEEAYEYGYDREHGEYTYQLRENNSGIEFGSYSFQITGAANGKGDWSKLTKAKPQITVAWKIVSVKE